MQVHGGVNGGGVKGGGGVKSPPAGEGEASLRVKPVVHRQVTSKLKV